MSIRNALLDELLAGQDPSSMVRQDGLLGELKKALLNRLMTAGFDHHLTQDRAAGAGKNHRNGSTRKRVPTDDSLIEVTILRDREARFDPVLIGKYQRRLPGFDDKVISLYTRGLSTREIQSHLRSTMPRSRRKGPARSPTPSRPRSPNGSPARWSRCIR